MSGIVGIFNLNGAPVDSDLLSRMIDSVLYRGPDADGSFIDQNVGVGLGHTLLRTSWASEKERQPFTLDGQTWVTADARIDARPELIQKLGRKFKPDETTDAELILAAYEVWGQKCVEHLLGDFGFAIWDGRTKRLFGARDHFGVKPFFYAHFSDSFIFSNTLNALRLDARVSDSLNEVAVGDYLVFGLNQDLSSTIFQDIQRLPPGHTLTISDGQLRIQRYWTPTIKSEVRFRDSNSYVERFRELLSVAVGDRLRTDCVGISMSGGLDSSTLAAIACDRLNRDSVHGYSVVYDRLIPDEERHYSNLAASHIGISLTQLNGDEYSLFEMKGAGDMDQAEPFLLSPFTGQFNDLLRLCAGNGRVAFTGYDGDAFMTEAPDSYFAMCAKKLRLKDLATGMAWYASSQKRFPPIGLRKNLKRIFNKTTPASYPEWIDESFAKRINLQGRLKESSMTTTNGVRPAALQSLDSKVWVPLFEGYDPGATKLPLEFRHPLIDLRLIEYLLALPAVPWCVNKHILRTAMRGLLPQTVLNRIKTPLAGDPALQLVRRGSVRCLDIFDVNSRLRSFVNLDARQSVANELTSEGLYASLRVFALNYWLTNSQPIDRLASEQSINNLALQGKT
jgi:asparagine synthase (glutamine-hydrolysing)